MWKLLTWVASEGNKPVWKLLACGKFENKPVWLTEFKELLHLCTYVKPISYFTYK